MYRHILHHQYLIQEFMQEEVEEVDINRDLSLQEQVELVVVEQVLQVQQQQEQQEQPIQVEVVEVETFVLQRVEAVQESLS